MPFGLHTDVENDDTFVSNKTSFDLATLYIMFMRVSFKLLFDIAQS